MTDTTKQIDRQALLVLAADAGFSVVGCSFVMPTHSGHITEEIEKFAELLAARATPVSPAQSEPELTVWCGSMPESNGKSNFTAMLMRKGSDIFDGDHFTIARSEYPDRVRYEADMVRYIIGERAERPEMWDKGYDFDKHSSYTAPVPAPQQKPIARLQSYVSDRPFSKGKTFFEVVILDESRCADDMELFGAPAPAPATVPTNDEVYAEVCNERGTRAMYISTNAVNDVMAAVRRLMKGKATPAAQAAVPEGWKLVPIEPTDPMCWEANEVEVGNALWDGSQSTASDSEARAIWKKMIDVAPAAVPQGVNCDTPIGYRRDTTDPAEAANRMIAEVAAQGVEAPIPTSEVFAYAARKVEDELRQAREIMGVEAQKGGAA